MENYSLQQGFLSEGSVVIFPTDTVFGIGCRLYDDEAIGKIFKIKNRPVEKKLPVLCDILVTVNDLAVLDARALKLAHAFWPGPLTIILPSSLKYYEKTGNKTIGVRIPDHPGVVRLIRQNGPLVTTSVNISGEKELTNYDEIKKLFSNKVDYIYHDEKSVYLNIASTTVDLTNNEVKILREGTITKEEIEEVLNKD
ncbi:MAG TPA: threonylcarbamoyl-AMP synthase [Acholeplasma sp.]|jgi:L-threonylcarbamoyladenylate synthase|nr:L-threonylcarbamoyladenylate synthase [Acholeplasmatales bacterium]HHV33751.1 threonylcarbamoyl-AMP synthase [Acholeplasma sp.]